jgi:hypothetical protein
VNQYTNGTDLYIATETQLLKLNETGDGFDEIASVEPLPDIRFNGMEVIGPNTLRMGVNDEKTL